MCKWKSMQFLLGVTVLILGLILVPVGWPAFAQEGMTEEVIADYGSPGIPGVSKIRLIRFTLQPGATVENFTVETTNYCKAESGILTAVIENGPTLILGPGSRWTESKGLVYKVLRNDGDVPFVDVFIEITHAEYMLAQIHFGSGRSLRAAVLFGRAGEETVKRWAFPM